MMLKQLYSKAKKKHGQLYKDVVHDMFLQFGSDLPSVAYMNVCIDHAKPELTQQTFEVFNFPDEEQNDNLGENYKTLCDAVNNVRDKFPLEIDTFLECQVNGSYKSFEERSGITRTTLEKICKFAKHEILNEYNRLSSLD